MDDIFNVKESTVGKLFSGRTIYVIPKYQRPYAWEKKHVNAFWKDVLDTFRQKIKLKENFPGYFIGALYTRSLDIDELDPDFKKQFEGSKDALGLGFENENKQKIDFVEVLDGQQRLTTLFLLRKRFGRDGMIKLKNGTMIPSVIPMVQDRSFFWNLATSKDNIQAETYSQRKLIKAQKYFSNIQLSNSMSDSQIQYVVDNLFRVTEHRLQKSDFAIQIFQAQNDRGKKLTYLERLKSLFMLSNLRSPKENKKQQDKIQKCFSDLYYLLDKSMNLGVFKKGESGEDECLQLFYIMLNIGYDKEAMWASTEDIYDGYFKKKLDQDAEKSLNYWLVELDKMNQALDELNKQMGKVKDYGIILNSLELSPRSKALLLQLHCTFPELSDWHSKILPVSRLDLWVENKINNVIREISNQYTLIWEKANLAEFFEMKIKALKDRMTTIKQERKISLLDVVKWLEIAVWTGGNPMAGFRDKWNFVFNTPKADSVPKAAHIFWNDIIKSYRNSYLESLLTHSWPRKVEFLLKEIERYRHGNNLHDIPRSEIQLEHILPKTPKFDVKDVGFDGDEYDVELNSLANLTFLDEKLNKKVDNDTHHKKAQNYVQQLDRNNVSVKHVMGEAPVLGQDLIKIYKVVGTKSSLYRAYLRLRQLDIVLFTVENI